MEEHQEIIQKCVAVGCPKIKGNVCSVYAFPMAKWSRGRCPMAPMESKAEAMGKLMDPIKKSKRGLK